uniref:Uncharacterized protein n=1 Tax=Oryza rufipogon TaxID=4529 RepID=A0A0E0QVZ2_ORYRU
MKKQKRKKEKGNRSDWHGSTKDTIPFMGDADFNHADEFGVVDGVACEGTQMAPALLLLCPHQQLMQIQSKCCYYTSSASSTGGGRGQRAWAMRRQKGSRWRPWAEERQAPFVVELASRSRRRDGLSPVPTTRSSYSLLLTGQEALWQEYRQKVSAWVTESRSLIGSSLARIQAESFCSGRNRNGKGSKVGTEEMLVHGSTVKKKLVSSTIEDHVSCNSKNVNTVGKVHQMEPIQSVPLVHRVSPSASAHQNRFLT